MPLCQVCSKIDLWAFTVLGKPQIRHHSQMPGIPIQTYPTSHQLFLYDDLDSVPLIAFHDSLESLKQSAATCELCGIIETCVNETLALFESARQMGLLGYPLARWRFFLAPRNGSDGFQVVAYAEHENKKVGRGFRVMGGLGFCVDDGGPLAHKILGRTVPPSPKSPAALARIKKWINDCKTAHRPACSDRPKLPTRILEIRNSGTEVCVLVPDGLTGDYVALSHCWGQVQPTTLNRDTADGLMGGVKTNTLPQSFQDAVWVTHQLGMRYLWIDSLCIVQDDLDDWAREAARMSDVYGNAFLTIAASRAANCNEGFLGDRERPGYVPIPVQTDEGRQDIQVFILPRKYAGDWRRCERLEDEPLSSRGWAFQERYLSPCTLHFGHRQNSFECPSSFIAEDYCSVHTDWQCVGGPGNVPRRLSPRAKQTGILQSWNGVIIDYSRRKHTFPEDKLPALAGLASRMLKDLDEPIPVLQHFGSLRHPPNTGYLAGARWKHIIDDLCWELDRDYIGRRPDVYRAPTWSWASIDGPIQFYEARGPDLAIASGAHVDLHVDLDTVENPFGRVHGGWLHLRARTLVPRSSIGTKGSVWTIYFGEDDARFCLTTRWDEGAISPGSDDDGGEVFAIPLKWDRVTANKKDNERLLFGPFFLLVTPVEHRVPGYEGVPGFRRVGASGALTHLEPGKEKQRREALKQLAEKWTLAKEKGDLTDMLLL
ncbi:heterokaryon incompatibility protein-domain-containing protein [Echria macrotheca]|uniref:Heterokaryon incompatibility protein-domain-containing protein n=1 Tax=Echria macrotheca TaxID=438768 RepID=A0AAJ0B586_9PEZI|nr:heterokaryon incompatibility protein-domain-containing protein [Echria macrotheca]